MLSPIEKVIDGKCCFLKESDIGRLSQKANLEAVEIAEGMMEKSREWLQSFQLPRSTMLQLICSHDMRLLCFIIKKGKASSEGIDYPSIEAASQVLVNELRELTKGDVPNPWLKHRLNGKQELKAHSTRPLLYPLLILLLILRLLLLLPRLPPSPAVSFSSSASFPPCPPPPPPPPPHPPKWWSAPLGLSVCLQMLSVDTPQEEADDTQVMEQVSGSQATPLMKIGEMKDRVSNMNKHGFFVGGICKKKKQSPDAPIQ
eukprot:5449106-Pyramimonas_sp.AAC.1